MKTPSFACLRPGLPVLLAIAALLPGAARAAEGPFQINVRPHVERAFKGLGMEPLVEHGKIYAIASMDLIDNPVNKLVRPVNEFALLKNLHRVLAKHGFTEAAPGTKPQIILTVLYGRGWLKNPYLDDDYIEQGGAIDNGGGGAPTVTIVGVPKNIIRHKEPGYEEKLQRANGEKLIINVTAWEYREPNPNAKKREKPKQVWYTIINTDDADQDLNALMERMLEAGAGYFDHEIDKEEVSVSTTVKEGRVEIGTPIIVQPPTKQK